MNPKLIIFDCDGVLVDSEIVVHRIASKEMSHLGFPLTVDKSIEIFTGAADEDLIGIIRREYGKDIADDDFRCVLSKIKEGFKKDLEPIEGMSRFIKHLDQNQIEKCVASNSVYEELINTLTGAGLKNHFDENKIFSVSMVKAGKPKPDLFLHVADKMKILPKDSVVIEDSVVGITAAKAAKMPVIGFLGGTHAKNPWYVDSIVKAKPDVVVDNAFELLNIL